MVEKIKKKVTHQKILDIKKKNEHSNIPYYDTD